MKTLQGKGMIIFDSDILYVFTAARCVFSYSKLDTSMIIIYFLCVLYLHKRN